MKTKDVKYILKNTARLFLERVTNLKGGGNTKEQRREQRRRVEEQRKRQRNKRAKGEERS